MEPGLLHWPELGMERGTIPWTRSRARLTTVMVVVGALAAAVCPTKRLLGGDDRWLPTPAQLTARQVTETLFKLPPGARADFSGKVLGYLDLSELDFKGALIRGADLYGTDFTSANLEGADLSRTRLDRTVIIRADFSGADLSGATLLRPTVHQTMAYDHRDAPSFAGAKLVGIRVQARLDGAGFRGADLTRADFSPLEQRPGQGTLVTLRANECRSCDFSGAKLVGANLSQAYLTFARFAGADLTDAILTGADLSMADLSGARLDGADLAGADLDGAKLVGVIGLESAKGLDTALHLERAKR